ncbi:hypothetical protein J6590_065106 [Homalodisca vitripennis]|nr:hypothetical protein J6590_065106 [Homalodisca vitripennis]
MLRNGSHHELERNKEHSCHHEFFTFQEQPLQESHVQKRGLLQFHILLLENKIRPEFKDKVIVAEVTDPKIYKPLNTVMNDSQGSYDSGPYGAINGNS